jgi:hypothetical protein
MDNDKKLVAGVDIVDRRFVVCLLDEDGKDPRYYSGRSDTPLGRKKFFSLIEGRTVTMPPDPLSTLAFHRFGGSAVSIDRRYETYYQAAGIERGKQMAKCIAHLMFHQGMETTALTKKEEEEILLKQQEELKRLIEFTDSIGPLMERLINGTASPGDIEKLIRLEVESRYPENGNSPSVEDADLPDPKENTFFARLFRYLKALT